MAKLRYKLGQGSVILRLKILDSTSTVGAGKTGLTFASAGLIIGTIADNEAATTAYTAAGSTTETITTLGTYAAPTATKCRFKEIDATNHPGTYEIQLADARFAVASAKSLIVSVQVTGGAQVDAEIQLSTTDPNDGVRQGMTALPNAAADAAGGLIVSDAGGLDADALRSDVAAILVDTGTTLDARIPAALVGGRIDANVGALSGDATAADNAEAFFDGTGYAGTNNVIPTVTTVGTLTTYTGNTPQTGDGFARLGAPAGASIAADIAQVEAQTDDIGTAGAGLTAVPWNAAWDAEVESEAADALAAYDVATGTDVTTATANLDVAVSTRATPAQVNTEVDTALADVRLDELLAADSDIDGAAPPAVGSVVHELMTKTAGSFTYDQTTDSLEALRDNMALASALATVQADTDDIQTRLPAALVSGRIDASVGAMAADVMTAAAAAADLTTELQAGLATAAALATVQADTDAIQVVLGTPAGASLAADIAAVEAQTDDIGANGAGLTAVGWNPAWDAEVESEVADALAVYDAPTSAELVSEINSVQADIAALNNLSAAQVNAEVDTALADVRLDELLFADSDIDGAAPPTVGSVFHELLTKTAGSFTYDQATDSLEALADAAAPPSAATIADAVWDEARAGHVAGGSFGEGVASVTGSIGSVATGGITSLSIATDAIGASEFAQSAADKVWASATRTLSAFGFSVTVGTNGDKTGYTLSAPGIQAIWDALTSALTTVGSVGKRIADNLDATITSRPTAAAAADAVWDETLTDHLTGGSTGSALNAAGSAGDPWTTALPGAYGAGTAGFIVGTDLDATISSRASAAALATVQADTDDLQTRIGTPAGASVSADIAAIEAQTDDIGIAGAGLTAVPWNAAWDAEAQSEVADALLAYDAATGADVTAATANLDVAVSSRLATAGYTAPPAASANADAVWDEALAGHAGVGSAGEALSSAGMAADPWGTALPGAYGAGTAGFVLGSNLNATVGSRATPAQVNAEVLDVLTVDTFPEPTAMPASTCTLADRWAMLFMALRNRVRQTETAQEIWNDAEDTPVATAVVSDAGTETVRGRFES